MILLDTNVVSALMRLDAEPAVERWLETLEAANLYVPVMVVFELEYGIACLAPGRKRRRLEAQRDFVLSSMLQNRIVPFHGDAVLAAASIYAEPPNRNLGKKVIDFQIAGIARVTGAPIATRNTRDFTGLGVHLINPWAA